MSERTYGNLKLDMQFGGHPIWISVKDKNGGEIKISHRELFDMLHLVQMACMLAKADLPENYKHEVPKGYQ